MKPIGAHLMRWSIRRQDRPLGAYPAWNLWQLDRFFTTMRRLVQLLRTDLR